MTIDPAQYSDVLHRQGSEPVVLHREGSAPDLGPLPRRNLALLNEKVFPALRALIRMRYFSLEVEGTENVPRAGAAVYVGNHAGWFTLDTLMGAVAIADHVGADRLPWGAVQDQLLRTPRLGTFFESFGGFPASWLRTPQHIPAAMQVFSIYPEGTAGNCKSFVHAYQMRAWRSGFLRIAVARRAPIVPVAIIGGEECLPSLSTIRVLKPLLGTILPLPLSLLPLPTRWKFIFLPPIVVTDEDLGGPRADLATIRARASEVSADIAALVQRAIDRETAGHLLVRFSKLVRETIDWSARPTYADTNVPDDVAGPFRRIA